MPDSFDLSRRERQIMDAVFELGEATVNQVVETIPSPPTPMNVSSTCSNARRPALPLA